MTPLVKVLLLGLPLIVDAVRRKRHRAECIETVGNLKTMRGKIMRDEQGLRIAGGYAQDHIKRLTKERDEARDLVLDLYFDCAVNSYKAKTKLIEWGLIDREWGEPVTGDGARRAK